MTFGNNDCKYHDNAPPEDERVEFYTFIFDLWFKNHKANIPYAKDVKQTFLNGGYYKVDINDKVSILSYNSLAYNKDAISPLIGQSAAD